MNNMTTGQALFGINSFLLIVLFFFVRTWISDTATLIKKLETEIDTKLDADRCDERYGDMKKKCSCFTHHKHAPDREGGLGGEVIIV